MTVSSLDARNEYVSAASQTVFNFTFKIFIASDLAVYVTPSGQDSDDSTDLTTDYVVDPGSIGIDAGGFFTFNTPLNAGDKVSVVSEIPYDRTVDYQNNGDFLPGTVNGDNDRQVAQIKQILEVVNKTVVFGQASQNTSSLTLPDPVSKNLLRWKEDLSGLENTEQKDIGTVDPTDFMSRFDFLAGLIADTTSPDAVIIDFFDASEVRGSGSKWVKDGTTGTASTLDLDNGKVFNANGDGYLYQLVNGKVSFSAFGALPDWNGSTGTDNSAVLENCLTFSGQVFVPTGHYLLATDIVHVRDAIDFEFEERYATVFFYNGVGQCLDLSPTADFLFLGRIRFTDFTLRSTVNSGFDFPNYVGAGLKLTNYHGSDMGNPSVWGFHTAIEIDTMYLNTFSGLETLNSYKGLLLTGGSNGNTFTGGGHLSSSFDLQAAATNNTFIGIDVEPASTTCFLGTGNKMISPRFERPSLQVAVNPWLDMGNNNIIDDLYLAFDGSSIQPSGSFMVSISGSGNKLLTKTPYVHQQGFFFAVGSRNNELIVDGSYNDAANTGNVTAFNGSSDWIIDYGVNNTLILNGENGQTSTVGDKSQRISADCPNGVPFTAAINVNDVTISTVPVVPPLGASGLDLNVRKLTLTATSGSISTSTLYVGDDNTTYSGEIWVYFPTGTTLTSATLRLVQNTGKTTLANISTNKWLRMYKVDKPRSPNAVKMQLLLAGAIGGEIYFACPRVGPGYASGVTPYLSTQTKVIGDSEVSGEYESVWSSSGATQPVVGDGELTGSYYKAGKMIFASLQLTIGSTTTFGDPGDWAFRLPFAGKNETVGSAHYLDSSTSNGYNAVCELNTSGTFDRVRIKGNVAGVVYFGPSSPVVPAVGDVLTLSIVYREA